MPGTSAEGADVVESILEGVDVELARLQVRHRQRLACTRGCSACCVDDIAVVDVEADRIRAAYPELLASGVPHPPGACAFLDAAGACRIYPVRPYVCRTEGLPLRWVSRDGDGQPVDRRTICDLNAAGAPIDALDPSDCWTLGPVEDRLREIHEQACGRGASRRRLRDLFASGDGR